MKRFTVKPYDDYKSWGDYDGVAEAITARTKLAMSFFSREVVIIDNKTGREVDQKIIDDYYKAAEANKTDEVAKVVAFNW